MCPIHEVPFYDIKTGVCCFLSVGRIMGAVFHADEINSDM
jgi:hypothetical protein